MEKADGMNYAPKGQTRPVCERGDFRFGVIGLDHGHINGMTNGLEEAGGLVGPVWDRDPEKVAAFCSAHPSAVAAASEDDVLDAELNMVASAAITSERAGIGLRVLDSGKDFFSDKAPFTTLDQLEQARAKVAETQKIWSVYYSERLHVEAAVYAGNLVKEGAIGRVVQVMCIAPHRLNAPTRPEWFFRRSQYGGILCDIGSHQIEQILFFTGATDAEIRFSQVANFSHPEYRELEDFGEATLVTDTGASGYLRVDWFTPDGLSSWGDGRVFILGTEGYMELRKYLDVARDPAGDHIYLVNGSNERYIKAEGTVGYPFFGQLILDSLNQTHEAMPQEHTFKAAELALEAQRDARLVNTDM